MSAYRTGFNHYKSFVANYSLVAPNGVFYLPDEKLLMNFVVYLSECHGLSHQAIKLYLSGVRHFFIMSHSKDPLTDDCHKPFLKLQLLLRGIKKSRPTSIDTRLPITIDILRAMCQVLLSPGIFGCYTDTLLASVFTIAFWGFLRCSEFTSPATFDPDSNLTIEDIIWSPDHSSFDLRLKKSKSDPFRQGVVLQFYPMDKTVCPVAKLKTYLDLCYPNHPPPRNNPVFMMDGKALSRDKFIPLLKTTLRRAGFEPGNFNGHSFRKGGASTAARSGVQDHMLQVLGRWNSDAYLRYIQTDRGQIRTAQKTMCSYRA